MNIVCIPYHDWRKITQEGFRTRDAHFIHNLSQSEKVNKLLIINRPTTFLEILVKNKKSIQGKIIFKNKGLGLYQVSENIFVLDYISLDFPGQILKRKKWFFESFNHHNFHDFFEKSIDALSMNNYNILSQNIFSYPFIEKYNSQVSIFDAWDNFLLFPDNESIREELTRAYESISKNSSKWITNSSKNIEYFTKHFPVSEIDLVKNGVDFETFEKKYDKPNDLQNIDYPIIGFGGKITHLFDFGLFNYCVEKHPDKNFVLVGQILDKSVFSEIIFKPNVHYLGDKHYRDYPAYVCNFDLGIVPYVTNHLESGANTIKVYEYLAANLSTVGTEAAGMKDLDEYMFVASSPEVFSKYIETALRAPKKIKLDRKHSWKSKIEEVLNIFKHHKKKIQAQ